MFAGQAIGTEVYTEQVWVSVATGWMVCFEDEFVFGKRGSEQEAEVKDPQYQGMDASADGGQWEEGVGREEGEDGYEDLQDVSRLASRRRSEIPRWEDREDIERW